jgi:serine/threonine-protein kinase
MSFLRRLFGRDSEAPAQPREPVDVEPPAPRAPPTTDAPPQQLADPPRGTSAADEQRVRLRRAGREGGFSVDEAVALLRQHEGSPEQGHLLSAILEGLVDDPALEPLRVAAAALLDERGDRERALAVLSPARGAAAMMLAAELAAAGGNLARAVSMVERVLARDIDTPGARERHERWSAMLGLSRRTAEHDDVVTVVAPTESTTTFRLLRQVARGGAGTVYEAEDELLGRRLAFKVYHRAELDTAQIMREARTAARLAGPGVLRIYDVDPEAGWLAAEWIAKGSLRDILKSGRVAELLPLSRWIPALLAALARVHDEGLVHADVKPANVLFRTLDDPVLGDFGVCHPAGEPSPGGTPGYMSPERLGGAPAEPADDVYAVGRIIEDVLAARDDGQLDASARAASEPEARTFAKVALACLDDAAARPRDAAALLRLLAQ